MEGRDRGHIEITDLLDEYETECEIESITEEETRKIDEKLKKIQETDKPGK